MAILRFPNGSAPGPSGLRPSHLQDLLRKRNNALTSALCVSLGGFCQAALQGAFPPALAPFLCAANLVPLKKGLCWFWCAPHRNW